MENSLNLFGTAKITHLGARRKRHLHLEVKRFVEHLAQYLPDPLAQSPFLLQQIKKESF